MPPAKAALKLEPTSITQPVSEDVLRTSPASQSKIPQRLPNALAGTEHVKPLVRSVGIPTGMPIVRPRRDNGVSFQARVPVITGEAIYRGSMPVDGTISGQLGAAG